MPKITSVEPQIKNPKRFNIYLDGKFAFGADEDLVVNHRLVPGKIIETEDLNKLLFEVEVGKLMERIYGLFSLRLRSEKEVRNYLKNLSFKRKLKGKEVVSDLIVELLIEKLKQKKLINDLEFAKAWIDARRKSKQKGRKALKMELYQKGIDREIIEQVTSGKSQESSEEDLAKIALEKKLNSWKNLDPIKFKKKAYDFLLRRGFDFEIVRSVVEKKSKK